MKASNTTAPIALVTGGSRGIGKSIVQHIAARGTDVVFTYQSRRADADALVCELKASGITANVVAPGGIATDFNGGAMLREEMQNLTRSITALRRTGQPQDIGGVVAALLAPAMVWVNGQRIEVSGGQNL